MSDHLTAPVTIEKEDEGIHVRSLSTFEKEADY
jgi:hypothetical protein